MNKFKKQIKHAASRRSAFAKEMMKFSDALKRITKLSDDDIKIAEQNDMVWAIGEYKLIPTHRLVCDFGWKYLLVIVPENINSNFGYSNVADGNIDKDSWLYEAKGTTSMVCPPPSIQEEIIKLLKKEMRK